MLIHLRLAAFAFAAAATSLPVEAADGVPPLLPPLLLANTPIGTWDVAITTFNCDSHLANPPFHSILAFEVGGTEMETTDNPALAVGQRSPAFGSWNFTGLRKVNLLTKAFILFSAPAGPIKQGTQIIRHAITLTDANSFTDAAVLTFYDTSGTATLVACAAAVGHRF
jgi:hypothetical protein